MKKVIIAFGLLLAIGANAQQTRKIGAYTSLTVRGSFEVNLVKGKSEATIYTSDKEIIDDIKIEVVDNELKIYMDNTKGRKKNKNGNNEIKIDLPYDVLNEIKLAGSGSITSDGTIESENIMIGVTGSGDIDLKLNSKNTMGEVTGSGDLTLSGATENFQGKVSGSGDLKAFGLQAQNTNVEVSGSGDADVYASENIKARVVGSGDIKYKGNPKMEDTKVAGSGDIEKA